MLQTELLLTALCDTEASFILIGGMAAVAQGSAYVTADLDIFYERQNPNYKKIAAALRPFSPRLRGVDPSRPFALDESTLRSGMNFTLTTDAGDIDLPRSQALPPSPRLRRIRSRSNFSLVEFGS